MSPKRKVASEPYFPPGEGDVQGQLARPAFFMQDSERYPRGFSPERQREIRAAFEGVHRYHAPVPGYVIDTKTFKERPVSRSPQEADARLMETIARSTVPVEDLRHLESVRTGTKSPDGSTLASYTFSEKSPLTDRYYPTAKLEVHGPVGGGWSPEVNNLQHTILHELGHHVDNIPNIESGRPERGRRALHARLMGDPVSEAFAENYADTHYREDRRFPPRTEKQRSGYDKTAIEAWKDPDALRTNFHKRWVKEYTRHRNISKDQFVPPKERAERRPRRNDPGPGQMSIFDLRPEHTHLELF